MDSSLTGQIILLIILLMLSGFFSMSETALMSLNKMKVKTMIENNIKDAECLDKLLSDPTKLLGAILIGNNIVNIGASSLATSLAIKMFDGSIAVAVSTLVITVLVLIFGEITPKSIAKQKAEKVAIFVLKPILLCTKIFKPFVYVFTSISNVFIRLFGGDPTLVEDSITEEELKTIVGVSEEEGILENDEKEMIFNVFDFADQLVRDCMVQRIDIKAIDILASYDDIIAVIETEQYSRLPVYDGSVDNIIGVLHIKDLLVSDDIKEKFSVKDFMRETIFTFEFMKVAELFKEMKSSGSHLAAVLDEYGSTVGLVTMEDLIEEIVGEIQDEYDEDESDLVQELNSNEYIVTGSTKLSDLGDMLGVNIEHDDIDSVGGLLIDSLGRIPEEGEDVIIESIRFKVKELHKNSIKRVHLLIME